MSGIFTPPGASARSEANDNSVQLGRFGIDTLKGLTPLINSQVKFANTLEPMRQKQTSDLLNMLQPGNMQASANQQIGAIKSNLIGQENDLTNNLESQGASQGAITGATAGLHSDATQQENQITKDLYSPERRAQMAQMVLQIIMGSQGIPGLQAAGQAAGITAGAPPVQVGPGFAEIAGNIAAAYAGGGMKK